MSRMEQNNIQPISIPNEETATHTIFIHDLVVDMMIGVYDHEKIDKQPVRLNIEMTVLDHVGPINDDYHNVVCYETIANLIKQLVQEEHINLVETLAQKIADICLDHQRVKNTKIKVEKLNAVQDAASVGIEITRSRG